MAILRVLEIRKMNSKDRVAKLQELEMELLKLKSQRSAGSQLDSPGKIRAIKRTVAKILTIEREDVKKQ
jgi:large subunit ribosomal protein L29